jgi:hypothetical protein
MLSKAKRLFLIVPMLACLFTVSSINQVSANNLPSNAGKPIATTSTSINDITLNNQLSNIATAQGEVKPQVYSNAVENYNFYLFGCFYYLSISRDSNGNIVCQEGITACGNSITFNATGDLTQCEDS